MTVGAGAGRFATLVSLLATTLVAVVLLRVLSRSLDVAPNWDQIDFAVLEEVDLLQRFIQVDTSHETGSELDGARFLADIFAAEDIPTEILDMGGGRANLVAVLEGDDPDALILHNHLDLDPIVDPDAWIHSPFSGHIDPPWIYGRGAFDMKSVTIAQLLAMVELRRQGIRPRRTFVFLATSSEEVDSELGTLWLLRHRPELFANVWGVLTEGGVLEARDTENVKYWGTEFAQKRYVRVTACSATKERLEYLLEDIFYRGQPLDGLRRLPPVTTFLADYASTRDLPRYRDALAEPDALLRDVRAFREMPSYLRGLFRDEIHPFPIEREGNGYKMRITLSILEDTEIEDAVARLLPDWMTAGVEIQVFVEPSARVESAPRHPLFAAITETLHDRYGPIPSGPYYQSRSATDARFFRAWNVPSYGFTPFLAFTTDTLNIAGPNEGLALPAFIDGVQLYKDLLHRIATTPGPA